jgi:hypothetical protein
MGDKRLGLIDYLRSGLDCRDCVIGRKNGEPKFCAIQKLADASGARQGHKKRPFFCAAYVPKNCDCGLSE